MQGFENILVGVDLSRGDWLATPSGDTPSHHACERAIAMAAASLESGNLRPKLHFAAALDLDERTKRLLAESTSDERTVVQSAEEALKHQVAAASQAGVSADYSVELGRAPSVLSELAISDQHDLVVIGSRERRLLNDMLMGSTAISLVAHCKVPVWVVKPGPLAQPERLLVATDFSPICNRLFDHAVYLAKVFDAELHVTHINEGVKRRFLKFSKVDDRAIQQAHDEAQATARQKLDELAARDDVRQLAKPLVTHLGDGIASMVIAEQTKALNIDLLLMGAIAWGGVPGLIMGSTAQQMLSNLDCSLMTLHRLD